LRTLKQDLLQLIQQLGVAQLLMLKNPIVGVLVLLQLLRLVPLRGMQSELYKSQLHLKMLSNLE
jgi:hypothetical protein